MNISSLSSQMSHVQGWPDRGRPGTPVADLPLGTTEWSREITGPKGNTVSVDGSVTKGVGSGSGSVTVASSTGHGFTTTGSYQLTKDGLSAQSKTVFLNGQEVTKTLEANQDSATFSVTGPQGNTRTVSVERGEAGERTLSYSGPHKSFTVTA